MTLTELREEIDKIDVQVVELLSKRIELVSEISEIKQNQNLAVFDENREQEIYQKLQELTKDQENSQYLIKQMQAIIEISKEWQYDNL